MQMYITVSRAWVKIEYGVEYFKYIKWLVSMEINRKCLFLNQYT